MSRLRALKLILMVTIACFAFAAAYLTVEMVHRQKALREVSRYNLAWVASQAVNETLRLELQVAKSSDPPTTDDKEEIGTRLDILFNRLDILRQGMIADFVERNPDQQRTIDELDRAVHAADPLLQQIGQPGVKTHILALFAPLEPELSRLAASTNRFGGERIAEDQLDLLWLHWLFSAVAGGLMVCALALITLLFSQNRVIRDGHAALRGLADDLRSAKDQAEAASEAKSRFLATMSHELRTPLNAVIGFSEIIASETFGPVGKPAYCDYAADILHSGHHMLELVDDILFMTKLDAGQHEIYRAPMDLRETIDKTVTMFRGTKYAGKRMITIAPNGQWPWILADERAVRQMVLNLLSNAAKFSDPGTPIAVRCDVSDDEIVVTVADQGIGMTEQEAAQAIRPFYQVDSRLARKYEGTGLGLSIVSGLMTCHGGRLIINSEPGIGSRISLVFAASVICQRELAAVA